jgi:hypothetical protein
MTMVEHHLNESLETEQAPIVVTPARDSIEHRLNAMYQELRCAHPAFPFTSATMFKKSILSAGDQDAELAYWQSIAKRR